MNKKNLIWIIPIILFSIWLRVDISNQNYIPQEEAFISNVYLTFENSKDIVFDKYSSTIFPAVFAKYLSIYETKTSLRIVSIVLSFILLFFIYKFTYSIFKDKSIALFSLVLSLVLAPLIYIGKIATSDVFALIFFTAFLWRITEFYFNSSNSKLKSIEISLLFIIAVASNYSVLLFLPFALFVLFTRDKGTAFIFSTLQVCILGSLFLLDKTNISIQLEQIFLLGYDSPFMFSKLIVRIAEYLAIPVMMIFAASQILWKSHLSKNTVTFIIISSLIIPVFIVVVNDLYNIHRLISLSIIFLIPFCSFVLVKFLNMDIHYKYSVIFIMIFISFFSWWSISKLENTYINTNEVKTYFSSKNLKNVRVYSEAPFFMIANFYPQFDEENTIMIDRNAEIQDLKKIFINGEADYLIINGLLHPEWTETIRERYLKAYYKVYTHEFKINTLLYPISETTLEVYKLKEEFRVYKKYFAMN